MKRTVTWVFDDITNVLTAEVQRQDGTGSDVVWSTTDTTPPSTAATMHGPSCRCASCQAADK